MNTPMNEENLRKLLQKLQQGGCEVEEAVQAIAAGERDGLSYACLDHQRQQRTGRPEIVFGEGKTPAQLVAIFSVMLARDGMVMATRVSPEKAALVTAAHPEVVYYADAMMLVSKEPQEKQNGGVIKIISAGTSDLHVAEEARVTAWGLGNKVDLINDIGVAGIHRMVHRLAEIRKADVLIVVAGMEGALPSVVAGLVSAPVIALPTSVGYGTGLGGVAALLGMLNSCAPGLGVVNIDNGFGAGCLADAILKVGEKKK
jgi:NCAIR mutase (PurE)-related protein